MIIYNFFKHLFLNRKYTRLIRKVYKDERLLEALSKLFGVEFKIDWVGRAYAVLNPNIDENGNYSPNTQIFEYNEAGLDNSRMVEQWVFEKLNVIQSFIQTNNLFDVLTYSLKRLDGYDNYLFILEPITLSDFWKWSKRMLGLIGGVIVIGIILAILL